jgi:GNAT superfamily N-acetyltransferase
LLAELGYPVEPAAVASRLERLRIVGDRVMVAEIEGVVVGLAHLHVSPAIEHEQPTAKLGALIVEEPRRGQGIGSALVAAIEEEARMRKCGLLYLTTGADRAEAHGFYVRLGFEETGKRFARPLHD